MTLLLISLLTSLSFASSPQKSKTKASSTKKTHIDFEEAEITGELVKPTLKDVTVTKHKRFKPISQSRKHFGKEISKSVKEI